MICREAEGYRMRPMGWEELCSRLQMPGWRDPAPARKEPDLSELTVELIALRCAPFSLPAINFDRLPEPAAPDTDVRSRPERELELLRSRWTPSAWVKMLRSKL